MIRVTEFHNGAAAQQHDREHPGAAVSAVAQTTTTVILLRHADKAAAAADDPPLTAAGQARATALLTALHVSPEIVNASGKAHAQDVAAAGTALTLVFIFLIARAWPELEHAGASGASPVEPT